MAVIISDYKLFTNLMFNWEVSPLDDVPSSFVPFGSEPQVCAELSSKKTERMFELLRFQMSLQFRYLSRRKALCMQDSIHFSIIFSVNEVYQQAWASLVCLKRSDSQRELLVNYLPFFPPLFFYTAFSTLLCS